MRNHGLLQPLVTRPAYGQDSEEETIAQSKLPEGSPGGKGLPLYNGLPGTQTFVKPEEDIRNPDNDDESIWRVDGPDDLAKDRSRIDVNEDNADKHDGIGYGAPGKQDGSPKTKYPYRDGRPNHHNAYVIEAANLRFAHELTLPLEEGSFRVATRLEPIETGLNPAFEDRARSCSVTLKRADIPNLRWVFAVDCGNGPKVVRVKAARKGRTVQMTAMDLHLACSCPAWRWLGPEHHSKREDYLDGSPRGTASVPRIRDPEGINRVCKHVAAVLNNVRKWQIPSDKRRAVKQAMKMKGR